MIKGNKGKINKPNGILYFLVFILTYPFLKAVFRLKVDRRDYRPPAGPYVLLSNHQSFMDFLLPTLATYPRTLNVVAAQKFFFYKPLDVLLPVMGCIPKNLFEPDMRSIMGIMAVIKRGGRILIFPEGRCSTDGGYMGMHKSTGKLIKKLDMPVITCRIDGSYNCMPLWRKGFRPGNVRVTLANLFDAGDTRGMDVDEINARIDGRLSGAEDGGLSGAEDDARIGGGPGGTGAPAFGGSAAGMSGMPVMPDSLSPPEPAAISGGLPSPRVFKTKRLAEGLENILYYCPGCGGEFTLQTAGNIICCKVCGRSAELDAVGKFCYKSVNTASSQSAVFYNAGDGTAPPEACASRIAADAASPAAQSVAFPENIFEWFKLQVAYEKRRLREEPSRTLIRAVVRMHLNEGKGLEECGEGDLWVDGGGWHFNGRISGERADIIFPIDTVPALPFDPDDNFQIYSKGHFYVFTPKGRPDACVKYVIIGECVYWRDAANIQMTYGGVRGFQS